MSPKNVRLIAIGATAFIAAIYLLAWSPVFSVKKILVVGLPKQVAEKVLIEESGITLGDQLARIEPRSIERSLQEISWVKEARISRNWVNGSVTISLTSRVPVGIFSGRALDQTGTLFDFPGEVPSGLPVVSSSTPELGLRAIELFTQLPPDFRDSLLTISATNASAITSWQQYGNQKVKIRWGSTESIAFKITVFRRLMELPENKNVKEVDLAAPHAPIVK